ncbi:MAG: nucleoside triphosphate pyrophosphohydrolase [Geminicoccaceae bacterium]
MTSQSTSAIERLLAVMAKLRDPDGGCPWDIEQTFETIAPYTIEEAYEVADAVARGDMADLKEELGDLLLQVVYHSQMASEVRLASRMASEANDDIAARSGFTFEEVAAAIADKMIRRHPHVFGDATVESAAAQTRAWEEVKAEERKLKGKAEATSLLDDIPLALPALTRAEKQQKRAARGGCDWPETSQVLAKIDEELGELKVEIADGAAIDRLEDELGDVLCTVVNLARHLKIDPEKALRRTNDKFERRFRSIEQALERDGRVMTETPLDELETLWQAAKGDERR